MPILPTTLLLLLSHTSNASEMNARAVAQGEECMRKGGKERRERREGRRTGFPTGMQQTLTCFSAEGAIGGGGSGK